MNLSIPLILKNLKDGEIFIEGQFMWGSNYTFLVRIHNNNDIFKAVYKPIRGEQPLWDFPTKSLAKRETAAFEICEALNWNFVPPTVYRGNAPYGPGSLQYFIDHDPEYHYFKFSDNDRQKLRPIAIFDLVVNNADRKGSHVFFDNDNNIWAIDHGICFHVVDKLRTVIWDFAGEEIPGSLIVDIQKLKNTIMTKKKGEMQLFEKLNLYLEQEEIKMLISRIDHLCKNQQFPYPLSHRRSFPWPSL